MCTDARFEQWDPLVAHVVRVHFWWVYKQGGSGASEKLQRGIGYQDLIQEGRLGLLNAFERFSPDSPRAASFKTYAYKLIYRQIKAYIRDNISPVRLPKNEPIGDLTRLQMTAAINYMEFSEIKPNRRQVDEIEFAPTPPKNVMWQDSPEAEIDESDFRERCMDTLRRNMYPYHLDILLKRQNGSTWREIGCEYRRCREWARKEGQRAMEIARRLLCAEAAAEPDRKGQEG